MSKTFQRDIDEHIRARYSLLYVVTWEEERARKLIGEVAAYQKKTFYEWSVTDGLRRVSGAPQSRQELKGREREPLKLLNLILQASEKAVYLLKDFHVYLETPGIVRQLRDLSLALRQTRKTIIVLAPILKIPVELEKSITIIDLALPGHADLGALLAQTIDRPRTRRFEVKLSAQERDAMIKAAQGLTLWEAENAFAKAIVRDNELNADDIQSIIDEKQQIIRKSGLLDFYPATERLEGVGGMGALKDWLNKRGHAFSKEAREYGLPQPRGILLMGVQGCGKSLVAKSVASFWRLPLLRLDMSRIFQGYIGSSESNMRRALEMAESLSPVILWIDEIDKAFSGVEGSNSTDAGTTARVVGQYLTWMQEKNSPVFVVATANSVSQLPPELLRKGRLDEIFFVDLPNAEERCAIWKIHLRKRERDPGQFDVSALVKTSEGFSGAEIEQALISAMHDSFFEDRPLETRDLEGSLKETVPLSRTMREKIDRLRRWAHERARPVSFTCELNGAEAADGSL